LVSLRKPTEEDLARFRECLAAEPDHQMQNPDDWTHGPGEFWVFFDEKGERVWVRIERVLRMHIQHDQKSPRKSIVSLIYKGFSFVLTEARKNGFEEIVFQSTEQRLIAFCKKLFGFKEARNNLYVRT
jgi:hypothetical protein